MSARLKSTRFFAALALLGAISECCVSAAAGADSGGPLSSLRFTRGPTSPPPRSRQPAFRGASPVGGNWVIRDLGLPRGLPAGGLSPVPYALNQHGDVALELCAVAGCGGMHPASGAGAYVYDYACTKLIALARLPKQSKPPTVDEYIPHGLNDRGQIVGAVVRAGAKTVTLPVLWTRYGSSASTLTLLDSRATDQGAAFAINNLGVAVGSSYTGSSVGFEAGSAVRFTSGAPQLLGANLNNGLGSDAFAINDAGVAVGDAGYGTAAVFQNGLGIYIALQAQCVPGDGGCFDNAAVAINKAGDVLGNYLAYYFDRTKDVFVGFLLQKNLFSTLVPSCFFGNCPPPTDFATTDYVVALNDADDFVGYFDGQPWVSFSPTGDAGSLLPPSSGWQILTVAGINDRRQIVGTGYHAGFGSTARAFLLEPATLARQMPLRYCGP